MVEEIQLLMFTSFSFFFQTGIFQVILRMFDVVDYLLDVHEAYTRKWEEKQQIKGEEHMNNNNNVVTKKNTNHVGIIQDIENVINEEEQDNRLSEEQISFTVAQTDLLSDTSSEEIVAFDQIISNDGDTFDRKNSKFCCQTPGVYIFFFSSIKSGDKEAISLIQDGFQTVAKPCKKGAGSSDGDQISHMGILHLKKGNQVWLQYTKDADIKKGSYTLTTFSGFLLHQQ